MERKQGIYDAEDQTNLMEDSLKNEYMSKCLNIFKGCILSFVLMILFFHLLLFPLALLSLLALIILNIILFFESLIGMLKTHNLIFLLFLSPLILIVIVILGLFFGLLVNAFDLFFWIFDLISSLD